MLGEGRRCLNSRLCQRFPACRVLSSCRPAGAALRQAKNAIEYCEGVALPVEDPAEALMREYTLKEKTRITAGAVMALVIVGWLMVLAIAFLSVP